MPAAGCRVGGCPQCCSEAGLTPAAIAQVIPVRLGLVPGCPQNASEDGLTPAAIAQPIAVRLGLVPGWDSRWRLDQYGLSTPTGRTRGPGVRLLARYRPRALRQGYSLGVLAWVRWVGM